jgi:hypothetical protein
MSKTPLKRIPLLLIAGVIIWGVISHYQSEAEKKRQQEEQTKAKAKAKEQRINRIKLAIADLALAHNAVSDWRQSFAPRGEFGRIYSAELARVLIRPDGRPLLFITAISDVNSSRSSYTCIFQGDVNLSWRLKLLLACTPDQAAQIMHNSSGTYAVVAYISSIGAAEQRTEEDGSESEEGRFLAYGRCVGQVYLGKDYYDDLYEILSFPVEGRR